MSRNLKLLIVHTHDVFRDVSIVTVVFAGFLAVGMLYTYFSVYTGIREAQFLAIAASLAAAATLITLWALWVRLVDRLSQRYRHPAKDYVASGRTLDEIPVLQLFLGTTILPNSIVISLTVVGVFLLPAGQREFGVDFRRLFLVFYSVVLILAPVRRLLVMKLLGPQQHSSTSSQHSAPIANIFD